MKKIIIISILAILIFAFIGVKCTEGKTMGKFEKGPISYINPTAFTLLNDGKVLFVFDRDPNNWELMNPGAKANNAEIYDTVSGKFTLINPSNTIHNFPSLVTLQDGRVLLLGSGYVSEKHKERLLKEGYKDADYAEIYDPKTNKFSFAGKMIYSRMNPAAVFLPNNKVLVVGGDGFNKHTVRQAELYDPETGKFELTGSLIEPNRINIHTILLKNNKVLILGGGTKTTELYTPETGKFSYGGNLNIERPNGVSTVMLKDGRVIIYGELDFLNRQETWGTRSEIYDPNTNKFTLMPEFKIKRRHFTATLLKNGKVLFAGGNKASFGFGGDSSIEISKAEIYDPEKNEFFLDAKMIYPRVGRFSIPLKNGDILFIGGHYYNGETQIYHLDNK